MSFTIKLPYKEELYHIGQGFDPIKMSPLGSVMLKGEIPMIHIDSGEPLEYKSYLVKNSQDYEEILNRSIKGSFSGWGASASASVSTMSDAKMSEKSITWAATAHLSSGSEHVDISKAKLTEQAKAVLKKDPDKFLELYGSCFIAGVIKGGFYTGFYSYKLIDKTNKSEIAAALQVEYDGLWSGDVKAQEKSNKIAKEYHMEEKSYVRALGVKKLDGHTSLNDLVSDYAEFIKDMPSNEGKPIGMICYSWDQLTDVTNTLAEVGKQFTNYPFSVDQQDIEDQSKTYFNIRYLQTTLSDSDRIGTVRGNCNKEYSKDLEAMLSKARKAFDILNLTNIGNPPKAFMKATTLPANLVSNIKEITSGTIGFKFNYSLDQQYFESFQPKVENGKIFQITNSAGNMRNRQQLLLTAIFKGSSEVLKVYATIAYDLSFKGMFYMIEIPNGWQSHVGEGKGEYNSIEMEGESIANWKHHKNNWVKLTNGLK